MSKNNMEFKCNHCCVITKDNGICPACGSVDLIPIIIEVQTSKNK